MANQYEIDNYERIAAVTSQILTPAERIAARSAVARTSRGTPIIQAFDPETDLVWARDTTTGGHGDFNYHFSGQDISIYIDGVDKSQCELPIIEFAFNIQQQKQPVYGFWSYNYDAIMRGTRIVSGQFRIATISPGYMTNLLSKAAEARVNRTMNTHPIRGLDIDEANIEKYWTRTVDPQTLGYKHLFSSHPPFNFVVIYGMETTSISNNPEARLWELSAKYEEQGALMSDFNERLIESDPEGAMRIIVEGVELSAMQIEYTPDGQVCSEVYSFFARDLVNVNV